MEHFLKKFTVIDFLGIFVPGGIVVVAFNQYYGGVVAPFEALFGPQPAVLVMYVVILAYVVGIGLQELSKPLEKLFFLRLKVDKTHQKRECVKERYRECFNVELEEAQRIEKVTGVGRDIYLYVEPELEQTKVPLFHAFATMGRSCFMAAVIVPAMNAYAYSQGLPNADYTCSTYVLCAVGALLMAYRCRRFHRVMQEYVYSIFIRQHGEKTQSPVLSSKETGN